MSNEQTTVREAVASSKSSEIFQAITILGEKLRIGKDQAEAFMDSALAPDEEALKSLLLGIKLILRCGEKQNVTVSAEFIEAPTDGSAPLRISCTRVTP